ncbi:DUF397 domain-containing protein [Kitasatospora sp. NPDC048722]|uniref:DUF397 domain-containing protein n=1 Tax=Kitasatospora sp. NPDC048722 TaxID=3155639 RepID=UPI0033C35609
MCPTHIVAPCLAALHPITGPARGPLPTPRPATPPSLKWGHSRPSRRLPTRCVGSRRGRLPTRLVGGDPWVSEVTVTALGWSRSRSRSRSSCSSNGGECIEASGGVPDAVPAVPAVPVRDSRDPEGPVPAFPVEAWSAFVAVVRSGEFGEV